MKCIRNVVLAAVASALLLAACGDDDADAPATLSGIVRDPAPVVGDVELPDVSNDAAPFPMRADDGLLVVYFGYTSCPDVCPTTMSDLRRALEALPAADAARVDVAMITIDPARDDADVLTRYVQTFVPDGHALRTDDDALLRRAADAFGADYSVTYAADGTPEVAHTGFLYAVDDTGHMRVQWPFGTQADAIERDLALLLDEMERAPAEP